MFTDIILAAPGTGTGGSTEGVNAFWATSAGNILSMLMAIIGVLLVIGSAFKAASHISNSKPGPALKVFGGALIVAAFLFFPNLITDAIAMFGKAVGAVINSGGDIVNKGTGTSTSQ
jgi:uncharacterized membrane protein